MPDGRMHAGSCNTQTHLNSILFNRKLGNDAKRANQRLDACGLRVSFALCVCYTDNNHFRKNI